MGNNIPLSKVFKKSFGDENQNGSVLATELKYDKLPRILGCSKCEHGNTAIFLNVPWCDSEKLPEIKDNICSEFTSKKPTSRTPTTGKTEYNRYASASLVLGILGFVLLFVSIILSRIFKDAIPFVLGCLIFLTLSILGVVFGKKGLKSNKVGISQVGLTVSIVGLALLLLAIIIFVIALNGG